jgi:hypothetical protein
MLNYNWNLFAQAGLFGWKFIGLRGRALGKSLFPILVLGVGRSFLGLGRWQRISFGSNSEMEVKSFLWYDHWHPVKCLIDKFGFRAIYDAGSCLGARLSSTIRNGDRFWPCARSDNIVKIQINLPEIEIEGIDLHIWNSRSGDIKRVKQLEVPWYKVLWFSMAIPRHSFLL